MITTALALMIAGAAQKAPAVDYNVPIGASIQFHELVRETKLKLTAKDFAGAAKVASMLPMRSVSYRLDLTKVPKSQVDLYRDSAKFAIESWGAVLSSKSVIVEKKTGRADVVISFEPLLAPDPATKELPGAVLFFGKSPSEPRVEAVIGLKRTAEKLPTTGTEVHNEVLNAFGAYFGLGPTAMFSAATSRTNGRMPNLNSIKVPDVKLAEATMRLGNALRLAAKNKVVVKPTAAKVFLSEAVADFKPALEGDLQERRILIANNGDAPLYMQAEGDCSCIRGSVTPKLNPGETTSLIARYDTDDLKGDIVHHVILTTNDPEHPFYRIPAKIHVDPRFEFVFPRGDTVLIDDSDKKLELYLLSNEKLPWKILRAGMFPGDLVVSAEPFEGTVNDSLGGNKPRKVSGFRLLADLSKLNERQIFGRAVHSIAVQTTNPNQSIAKVPVFIQRGIVAQPEGVYLGEPSGPVETKFVVLRPNKPFKITDIVSNSKRLTTKFDSKESSDNHVVEVKYDGTAPEHKVDAELKVLTDDPKQPEIIVKVQTAL